MKRTYRPDPTTQRVQSHAKRKALARALHNAHAGQLAYGKACFNARRLLPIAIPYALRQHRRQLVNALVSA